MEQFAIPQQGDVHQTRIGRIEDGPVLTPAGLAKQSQDDTNNNKHQCHSYQHANHGRIDVGLGSPLVLAPFALHGPVLVPKGRHLEPADAAPIPALRLEVSHLALLVEEAGLVHGGLFATFVNVIGDGQILGALAGLLLGIANGAGEAAFQSIIALVAELLLPAAGIIKLWRCRLRTRAKGIHGKEIVAVIAERQRRQQGNNGNQAQDQAVKAIPARSHHPAARLHRKSKAKALPLMPHVGRH